MSKFVRTLALLSAFAFGNGVATAATLTIVNKDPVGVGFNDPTPATPVGGNSGTTLGQQRMNAFQHAANIWGSKLNSAVTIKIAASFGPLTPCTSSSGVLGSAGPATFARDFPNAPRSNTWYPVALASALSGADLAMAFGLPDGAAINAQFNSSVGVGGCLTGLSFYLGLDAAEGAGQIDLVAVLLHEFGHGLGFTGLVDLDDGSIFDNRGDLYAVFTRDNTQNLNWTAMSSAQRLASSTNNGNVVFDGTNATAAAATLLTAAGKDLLQHPKIFAPNPVRDGSSIYHFDTSASPNQLMEPSINGDLTHNIDVPNDLSTKVMQDLGWPLIVSLSAPTNVMATASAPTSVTVTWSPAAGAASYNVYRTAHDSTVYTQIASGITSMTFNDTSVSGSRAYLYKVRSFNGTTESADSNADLATTVIFTDPTLTGGATVIKAAHFTELRAAADAVRTLAGLGAGVYIDGTLTSAVTVKALHFTEIVASLNAARSALLLPSMMGPVVTGGGTIQASPLTTIRPWVQ